MRASLGSALNQGVFMDSGQNVVGSVFTIVLWIWTWWHVISKIGYRGVLRFAWVLAIAIPSVIAIDVFPDGMRIFSSDPALSDQNVLSSVLFSLSLWFLLASISGLVIFCLLVLPWPLTNEVERLRDKAARSTQY